MICKIGIKGKTLAALTCKLETVNPPNILPFRTRFYTVLGPQTTLEISASPGGLNCRAGLSQRRIRVGSKSGLRVGEGHTEGQA